ncbi:hypothetical protein [Mucilaginibacter glaciei]|uniref:Outer membrane protein beta-barrel domain-containing protein n=1 Tax=Mucilaginibacter glaciei TaxID=2772109 RepID=A0A926NRS5_9SPHI|nr:hypothetical protein [Mucilaginibacter glaciei]MBD1394846.1 hypothetical protein [Mucilaginibacter glaciei]
MKKLIFIIFTIATFAAHAQTDPTKTLSLGFDVGAPSQSIYSIGVGGSAKLEIPIVTPVVLSITAGYNSFSYKSSLTGSNTSQPAAGFIPIKAGGKFYFGPGIYLEAEAGSAIETNYAKDKLFAYALGPGFIFATGKHTGIDLSINYENWGGGRLRQTAIRVAYRLGW